MRDIGCPLSPRSPLAPSRPLAPAGASSRPAQALTAAGRPADAQGPSGGLSARPALRALGAATVEQEEAEGAFHPPGAARYLSAAPRASGPT